MVFHYTIIFEINAYPVVMGNDIEISDGDGDGIRVEVVVAEMAK